jgi:NAD/NADP transhydrogenase alpha subunit
VIIESGAGDSAQFPDSTYEAVGKYGLEKKNIENLFLFFFI